MPIRYLLALEFWTANKRVCYAPHFSYRPVHIPVVIPVVTGGAFRVQAAQYFRRRQPNRPSTHHLLGGSDVENAEPRLDVF